jgi:hypothetical protein
MNIVWWVCEKILLSVLEQFTNFYLNNQPDALIIQIYSVTKLYMFRAFSLPISRNFLLYIRHWQVSCRFLMTAFKQSQDEFHPDSDFIR